MIDIVVCADSSITRAGLAAMATTRSSQVVGQTADLEALSQWLQNQRANIAIIELVRISDRHWQILRQLADPSAQASPLTLLLLLDEFQGPAVLTEDEPSQRVSLPESLPWPALLKTGTVSLLPLTISSHQLRDAIASLSHGCCLFHPDFADALFSESAAAGSALEMDEPWREPLTPREIEVLNQLAGGLSNKAIAQVLNISEHTVKFHISAILSKLEVTSRTEALAIGIRLGLVML